MEKIYRNIDVMDPNQRNSLNWEKGKRLLYSGQILTTDFDRGRLNNLEFVLTLVVILERQNEDLTNHIISIQNKIKEVAPTQYYYPKSSMHITVVGCTQFHKQRAEISEERIAKINNICTDIIRNWTAPISLVFKGINVVASSVFVQVFSPDNSYGTLRNKIINELQLAGEDPIMQLDTNDIYINFVRFANREPTELRNIVSLISKLRNTDIGALRVKEIELDITDRVQSSDATTVIGRYILPSI